MPYGATCEAFFFFLIFQYKFKLVKMGGMTSIFIKKRGSKQILLLKVRQYDIISLQFTEKNNY
jgi:hypothetical protein